MSVTLTVMEATARFHRQAHPGLHAAGFAVAVVNPLRARLFAQATGQLARTGVRHIKGGRAFVRTRLYMAAVAAARHNPLLREDY